VAAGSLRAAKEAGRAMVTGTITPRSFIPLEGGAGVTSFCSPSSVALLLTASFVTGAERQVRSLVQLPRLAAELAAERAELRELLLDGEGEA